jgi:hypothetical protein
LIPPNPLPGGMTLPDPPPTRPPAPLAAPAVPVALRAPNSLHMQILATPLESGLFICPNGSTIYRLLTLVLRHEAQYFRAFQVQCSRGNVRLATLFRYDYASSIKRLNYAHELSSTGCTFPIVYRSVVAAALLSTVRVGNATASTDDLAASPNMRAIAWGPVKLDPCDNLQLQYTLHYSTQAYDRPCSQATGFEHHVVNRCHE